MRTECGFELRGSFRMPSDEPPGLEGGHVITLRLAGGGSVQATVTKVVDVGEGRRQVTFATSAVVGIDPPAPA